MPFPILNIKYKDETHLNTFKSLNFFRISAFAEKWIFGSDKLKVS